MTSTVAPTDKSGAEAAILRLSSTVVGNFLAVRMVPTPFGRSYALQPGSAISRGSLTPRHAKMARAARDIDGSPLVKGLTARDLDTKM